MKKIFLLCLLVPLLGIGQTKNVVSSFRAYAKVDKVLEFEKALTAHAQKYHTGDWKWRVYEIQTGPDAGGYHIVEGPNSWEQFDNRGKLGADHTNDWNKNVAIYMLDRYSSSFSEYQADLSSVPVGDFSDKINITHIFPKVGWGNKVNSAIADLKKTWEASDTYVAVYTASSSGPAQYSLVTRYKQGLKEKADGFRKPFKERHEGANGANSYDDFMEIVRNYMDEVWSELLFYRADLSSK